MPVSSMPRRSAECDLSMAEDWLSRKILPSYWVKEADGKNKYPLRVLSENESAHLLMRLENFYAEQGRPVYENVQVQILSIHLSGMGEIVRRYTSSAKFGSSRVEYRVGLDVKNRDRELDLRNIFNSILQSSKVE